MTPSSLLLAIAILFVGAVRAQLQAFKEAAPPGLYVGSVFHGYGDTWDEPDYQNLALKHFNIMTSSIYLPTVWSDPSQPIDVSSFTEVAQFLKDRNILVHGHSLLYPSIATLTTWWNDQPLEDVENNMFDYMTAVATAGAGLVYSWDVVNEVMGDDNNDMDEDGVRRAQFSGEAIKEYSAMGQDYIRKAFQFARDADPAAKLMLTDYGCEEDSLDNDNEKSDRLYRFVSKLLAEGIPIDGIGFQVHVGSEGSNPNYVAMARNFERFRKLGLLLYITEMDVISYSTLDPKNADKEMLTYAARYQSRVYTRILQVCMEEPACQSFRFWDFAEFNSRVPDLRYSWLHPITFDENRLGMYTYPTPFWDINPGNFRPKPAWRSMIKTMLDFNFNEGGVYRMTSDWRTMNSYLGRGGVENGQGGWTPGSDVYLDELDDNTTLWKSLKWRLERVAGTTNMYRIKNLWADGYLSREGVQNPDESWTAHQTVSVYDTLGLNWWSQMWIIEYKSDDSFTIRSRWSNGNDYLTRLGSSNEAGGFDPTNEVRLQSDQDYSSQKWYLERTL